MVMKTKKPAQITMSLIFGTASTPGVALADLVCHLGDDGAVSMLNVGQKAVAPHLRHGDYLPDQLFADRDGDGLGDPNTSIISCDPLLPVCYVTNGDDPNDQEPEAEGEE